MISGTNIQFGYRNMYNRGRFDYDVNGNCQLGLCGQHEVYSGSYISEGGFKLQPGKGFSLYGLRLGMNSASDIAGKIQTIGSSKVYTPSELVDYINGDYDYIDLPAGTASNYWGKIMIIINRNNKSINIGSTTTYFAADGRSQISSISSSSTSGWFALPAYKSTMVANENGRWYEVGNCLQ